MIHGKPSGICIREDLSQTTVDNSSFVPHYIVGEEDITLEPLPPLSGLQRKLRQELYGEDRLVETKKKQLTNSSGGSHSLGWWRLWSPRGTDSSGSAPNGSPNPTDAGRENIKTAAGKYHSKHYADESKRRSMFNKFKMSNNVRSKFASNARGSSGKPPGSSRFGSGRG